ncbi:MAG: protein-L-isoaspartate(D-aspartate) O-methyltransferase [Planctomycetia bacterium]|nr:protein-L-isoaspartate(D-aspartate) O-methyltransferase [Planctomycetia bacterium]
MNALRGLAHVACFLILASSVAAQQADPNEAARNRLADDEIAGAGIKDERVVESIRTTPRHEFMPAKQRKFAYFDMALPIGHGQTISPPFVVAYMTEQLEPKATDKVLEIGTGSGYQAAVLSPLVSEVYSIEIVEPLGKRAAATLEKLGYENVFTMVGDGYKGWPEHAPFDKIIVTCSPENVPQPLVDQLKEGGRMIVPLGERYQQLLYLFTKVDGKLKKEPLEATYFVPMTGEAEELRQVKPDDATPALVNGDFEKFDAEKRLPEAWYYVRQAEVIAKDGDASAHFLRFHNDTTGRDAHCLQAIGIDGREVKSITVGYRMRGENLVSGANRDQFATLYVNFFGEDRAPIRQEILGPWTGDIKWTEKSVNMVVPVSARGAVIGIGLFGATGTLEFDDITVTGSQR